MKRDRVMTKKITKGKISQIETMGLVDGPGMRMVVFMSGCKLRCLYCHNPETWGINDYKLELTGEELLEKYNHNKDYYGDDGGITFSGGEPLLQSEFLTEAVKLFKKNGIHVALDTSGVGEGYEKAVELADLIILDVKAVNPDEYLKITGHPIDDYNKFLEYVISKNKKLWLRQVIVPGLNDDDEHVLLLKSYISKIPNVERVELLPYHTLGVQKYDELKLNYRLKGVPAMDTEKCKELENLLKK